MKNLILYTLLFFTIISCKKEEEIDIEQYINQYQEFDLETFPQKWELIRIYANNSETTFDDIERPEFYIFKSDSTFTKYQERDGNMIEASGEFILEETSNDKFLRLNLIKVIMTLLKKLYFI